MNRASNFRRRLLTAASVFALGVGVAACGSDDDSSNASSSGGG
ncbi:MAG: Fe2+-enterobactin ABC transporter substrate-binding protein, partial [Patulibacter sp.]|nr:Fe2+-enterobactin ABC transporter substrate-binding protein [Patulibacter sp.]